MGYLERKSREVRAHSRSGAPSGAALAALRERAEGAPPAPSLLRALREGSHVGLIAEFKRRSPSAGSLAGGEDPAVVARLYEEAGAVGISVLTDGPDFNGSLADLRGVCGATRLPALCKDFLVDAAGLYEARLSGAAAALLIMRMLAREEVSALLGEARSVGLECLVEVHDAAELEDAIEAGATLIGINNRDLDSLMTDLAVTERLAPVVPAGITLVSESGIRSGEDVKRVRDAGVHAVLVGETLLRLAPAERSGKVAELAGIAR